MAERGTLSEVTAFGIILSIPSSKEGFLDAQRCYPWTAIVYPIFSPNSTGCQVCFLIRRSTSDA